MPFRSRREAEQVFGTLGLREPSRECITQDRLAGAGALPTTVNHDDATEASSPRALDALQQDAASGLEPQPMQIDPFFRFGFTPAECEKLCIADSGGGRQAGLIGVGPAKGRSLHGGYARARNSRFACRPSDAGGSSRNRLRFADEIGETFRIVALSFIAVRIHRSARPAARADVWSVTPNSVIALRVGPACARSSIAFGRTQRWAWS
jgi:hypothetical protein